MSYANTQVAQIVAISNNRCIGKGNDLPWHIPNDLKHFKAMTTAKTNAVDTDTKGIVIMGRKTFESMRSKPLPKRVNFVITTQLDYAEKRGITESDNLHIVHSLDNALTQASHLAQGLKLDTLWVIGGEQIFTHAMTFTDRIELTTVNTDIAEGDAFYPELPTDFVAVSESDTHSDEKSGLSYQFQTFKRK